VGRKPGSVHGLFGQEVNGKAARKDVNEPSGGEKKAKEGGGNNERKRQTIWVTNETRPEGQRKIDEKQGEGKKQTKG